MLQQMLHLPTLLKAQQQSQLLVMMQPHFRITQLITGEFALAMPVEPHHFQRPIVSQQTIVQPIQAQISLLLFQQQVHQLSQAH